MDGISDGKTTWGRLLTLTQRWVVGSGRLSWLSGKPSGMAGWLGSAAALAPALAKNEPSANSPVEHKPYRACHLHRSRRYATITRGYGVDKTGLNHYILAAHYSFSYIHILEVLHGVLYPEAHSNQF